MGTIVATDSFFATNRTLGHGFEYQPILSGREYLLKY